MVNYLDYNKLATGCLELRDALIELIQSTLKSFEDIKELPKTGEALTRTDQQLERFIINLLRKSFPNNIQILGEETMQQRLTSRYAFYIDPIDGTKNYTRKNQLFAISLGLWDRINQQPIYGLVFAPALKEIYEWAYGMEATLNGKKIKPSTIHNLADAIIGGTFVRQKKQFTNNWSRMAKYYKNISSSIYGLRILQCDSLTLAWVASGKLDGAIMIGARSFDVAGGLALINGAGGKFSSIDDVENILDQNAINLVVTNGSLSLPLT